MSKKLQFMNAMADLGLLHKLLEFGFMPPTAQVYREIYLQVKAHQIANGNKRNQAVMDVAAKMNIPEIKVWRAIKFFEDQ